MRLFRSKCWRIELGATLAIGIVLSSTSASSQVFENRGVTEIGLVDSTAQLGPNLRSQTAGISLLVTEFWPKLGLIEGNWGGFSTSPGFQTAVNYVRVSNIRLGNERISLTGGDLTFDPAPPLRAFTSLWSPALQINGFAVESRGTQHVFRAFGGHQVLLEGLRIPLVYSAGEDVFGADARFSLPGNISLSGRVTWFSQQDPAVQHSLFGTSNTPVPSAIANAANVSWKINSHINLLSEFGYSRLNGGADRRWRPVIIDALGWESARLRSHATYAQQPISYMPVAGYYAGARKSLGGDFEYHPLKWLNTFGSWTHQRLDSGQNLVNTASFGTSASAGLMVTLPKRTTLSAQYSKSVFSSSQGVQSGGSWQDALLTTIVAAHAFNRHTTHVNATLLTSSGTSGVLKQNSWQMQDDVPYKRLTISGAIRFQQSASPVRRDALYYSGGVQLILRTLTLYEHSETGSDLASRGLLSTTALASHSVGCQYSLTRNWNISVDAWRSHLTTTLAEYQSVDAAVNAPLIPLTLSNQQWTVFFKVTKRFSWGGGGYSIPEITRYAEQAVPRFGVVQGTISVTHPSYPSSPASFVTVLLDGYRKAVCDAYGKYFFDHVKAGPHYVEIDEHTLPVDFLAADRSRQTVIVAASRSTIVDFSVQPSAALEGVVKSTDASLFDNLYVQLKPGGQYTFVDKTGHFFLEGVPEGSYVATLVARKGQDQIEINPPSIDISLQVGPPTYVVFQVTRHVTTLPIRQVPITGQPPVPRLE